MFTILSKAVYSPTQERSTFERYFKSWDNAKEAMDDSVNYCISAINAVMTNQLDRFNADKGFYEYEKTLETEMNGETYKIVFALIEGHFED